MRSSNLRAGGTTTSPSISSAKEEGPLCVNRRGLSEGSSIQRLALLVLGLGLEPRLFRQPLVIDEGRVLQTLLDDPADLGRGDGGCHVLHQNLEKRPVQITRCRSGQWFRIALTLSMSISVDFSAPSGRPKGKQKRKLVICCSSKTRSRSFISVNCSFSSWVTVPTLPGLKTVHRLR